MQGKKNSPALCLVVVVALIGGLFTTSMVLESRDQKNIQKTEKLMALQETTSVFYKIEQVGQSASFKLRFPGLAKGEMYFYGCDEGGLWLSFKARRYLTSDNQYVRRFLQTRNLRPAPFHETAIDVSVLKKVVPYQPCGNLYYHEPGKDDWIVIETDSLFPEILYINHEGVFPAKIWKIVSNGNMANGHSQ